MKHALLLFFLTTLLFGCAGGQKRAPIPPEELYRQAQEAVEDYDFKQAQDLLDRIRDEYPFSKYAAEAELLGADMAFRDNRFEEAAASYRSFEELHPTHPKVPYAIYRRGMAYLEISHPADRDQTASRNAAEAFQKLLNAYPNSEYAAEAREHLTEMRSRLAAHELYVARYYVRKKKYSAALSRLHELVKTYPDAPERDEALSLALEVQDLKRKADADK